MKRTKQLISFLLAAGLLFTSVPAAAFEPPKEAEESLRSGYADTEDAYAIYPIPQSIDYSMGGSFTLGTDVSVVSETDIDSYTNAFLDEILEDYNRTKSTAQTVGSGSQILLGVKGSGGVVDQWAEDNITLNESPAEGGDAAGLFEKTDAYLLSAKNGTIVILGRDTDAVYYGLATLQMMFSSFNGNKFLNVQIEDFSSMKMRGFIEGFYGGWGHEGRKSLIQSVRDVKMNYYMYGPKHDTYHKNDEPYPANQMEEFKELIKLGEETKVKFSWSIHLSYFFPSLPNSSDSGYQAAYEAKFQKLKDKFQSLYDIGVRNFAVLGDDYPMGPVTFDQIVVLLNRLYNEFIVENNCDSLSYCMQGYNEAWRKAGELESFQKLNDNINLFWTGQNVNSPITQETVNFVKNITQRNIVFWLNYPVNEHDRSGMFLGDITHYVEDGVTGLTGAVSNPCMYTEANKPALFQLGCLFWNNNNYLEHANTIWENSFKYLQPEVYDAYLTIARNVSNCPKSPSHRVPEGYPESEYLADVIDALNLKLQKGQTISDDENARQLSNEFGHMIEAVETFRNNCQNTALIENLDLWLKALRDTGIAGKAALNAIFALEEGDPDTAWSELAIAGQAMDTQGSYAVPGTDRFAAAGSRRLVPFINKAIVSAKTMLIPFLNPSSTEFTPSFYAVIGGTLRGDDSNSAKVFDGDESTYAGYSVNQQINDYFGVDMGRTIPVTNIKILQSNAGENSDADANGNWDYFHNAILEYSIDGDAWTTIKEYPTNAAPRRINETVEINARYIRLRLTKKGADKSDYYTNIREFTINDGTKKSDESTLYANGDAEGTVTRDGLTYTLETNGDITLAPGEYFGIKLKELVGLENVSITGSGIEGLKKEYSANDAVWNLLPENVNNEYARYVRLYNNTSQPITVSLTNFTVTADSMAINPSVIEKPNDLGLQEGSWENLFDGDTSTYAWTNRAQRNGDSFIIDFGAETPIYDLTIITPDGNPKFYEAEFYVSTDKINWGSPIATVTNAGGDAVREDIFYKIQKDLGGTSARYLKILIKGNSGYYLRISEITINATRTTEKSKTLTGNLSGDLNKMIDGNISTVYTASSPSDGTSYVKYLLTENTDLTSLTFLQSASEITNAQIKAEIYDPSTNTTEEKILGTLSEASTTFFMKGDKNVLSITVTWPEGTMPVLYEILPINGEDVYTVSFSGEGAPAESQICPKGRSILLPENTFQKNGCTFKGWSDGTNTYAAGSRYKMGSADITLTAVWEKIHTTPPTPPPSNAIQENKIYSYNGLDYKVTSLSAATVEVAVQKNTALTKIVVPDTITLDKKSYKVTSVAASAFKNFKKAATAVIGKNVVTIGDSAFAGCVKLKKITINSTGLTSIGKKAFQKCKVLKKITIKSKVLKTAGKGAFKGIHSKAVIKVPAAKRKNYAKILAKKGQKSTVKIK